MKPVLYSIGCNNDKTTAIVFAVNQLSPNSIGIYPLAITYPKLLPQLQVRSINLVMAGSSGFGSNELDFICIHSVFHLTQSINLLTPYAKGNWLPSNGLSMVGLSVYGSISLPLGFLIQLSLSVLYTIAIQFYSAWVDTHLGKNRRMPGWLAGFALAFADCFYIITQRWLYTVDFFPILLILAFIFSLFTTQRVLLRFTYQLLRYLSSLAILFRLSPLELVRVYPYQADPIPFWN